MTLDTTAKMHGSVSVTHPVILHHIADKQKSINSLKMQIPLSIADRGEADEFTIAITMHVERYTRSRLT